MFISGQHNTFGQNLQFTRPARIPEPIGGLLYRVTVCRLSDGSEAGDRSALSGIPNANPPILNRLLKGRGIQSRSSVKWIVSSSSDTVTGRVIVR
jgi:hypothetical protein